MIQKNKIKKEILNVLKKIISIDTSYPPGHTLEISKFIKKYLKDSSFFLSTHYYDKNKPNIVLKNFRGNHNALVFNCHIDTVKPINNESLSIMYRDDTNMAFPLKSIASG